MAQVMVLFIATYPQAAQADTDFAGLAEITKADDAVAAAVVLHRDPAGEIKVVERGGGSVAEGAGIGAGAGLVIGLLAPPLLISTAIGAGIGALGGAEARRHEARHLAESLEGVVPPGTSAIVVVAAAAYAERLTEALPGAREHIVRPIDNEKYVALGREIGRANPDILEALPEQ